MGIYTLKVVVCNLIIISDGPETRDNDKYFCSMIYNQLEGIARKFSEGDIT